MREVVERSTQNSKISVDETMKHIGSYILNGLCPSPQIEMRFDSQVKNSTNGNDVYNKAFESRTARQYKEFKTFLLYKIM